MKSMMRTDGIKSVSVEKSERAKRDSYDLTICKNGWQSVSVEVDREMLNWLSEIIKKFNYDD